MPQGRGAARLRLRLRRRLTERGRDALAQTNTNPAAQVPAPDCPRASRGTPAPAPATAAPSPASPPRQQSPTQSRPPNIFTSVQTVLSTRKAFSASSPPCPLQPRFPPESGFASLLLEEQSSVTRPAPPAVSQPVRAGWEVGEGAEHGPSPKAGPQVTPQVTPPRQGGDTTPAPLPKPALPPLEQHT